MSSLGNKGVKATASLLANLAQKLIKSSKDTTIEANLLKPLKYGFLMVSVGQKKKK